MGVDYKSTYGYGLGDRVRVGQNGKKGTVAYLGETLFSKGLWAGITLDQKCGKHNGTILSQTYFVCAEGHGIFIRPDKVTADTDQQPETGKNKSRSKTNMPDLPTIDTSAFRTTIEKSQLFPGQTVLHFGCRAIVRYVGIAEGTDGNAVVGLELDAPVGSGDGVFNGKRLFQCKKDHAVFVPAPKDRNLRTICIDPKGKGSAEPSEERLVDFGIAKLSVLEQKNLSELVKLAETMADERDSYVSNLAFVENERERVEAKLDFAIDFERQLPGNAVPCTIDLTPFRKGN